MSKEITVQKKHNDYLPAIEIRKQVNLIQEVMKAVMKNNVHYGTIPGCGSKPTLLKAGAEKILATFRILLGEPIIDDLSTKEEIRYRIVARGYNFQGVLVGTGVGECSTNEMKYKWRSAICNEEFEETPEDKKREKWVKGKYGKPNYKIKQIKTEPADLANTVLKMAKKRAMIDLTLTSTGASDFFTQDIEDMPSEILHQEEHEPVKEEPYKISHEQVKRLWTIARQNVPEESLRKIINHFGYESTKDILEKDYSKIVEEIENTGTYLRQQKERMAKNQELELEEDKLFEEEMEQENEVY